MHSKYLPCYCAGRQHRCGCPCPSAPADDVPAATDAAATNVPAAHVPAASPANDGATASSIRRSPAGVWRAACSVPGSFKHPRFCAPLVLSIFPAPQRLLFGLRRHLARALARARALAHTLSRAPTSMAARADIISHLFPVSSPYCSASLFFLAPSPSLPLTPAAVRSTAPADDGATASSIRRSPAGIWRAACSIPGSLEHPLFEIYTLLAHSTFHTPRRLCPLGFAEIPHARMHALVRALSFSYIHCDVLLVLT